MDHTGFNEEHFVEARELWERLSPSRNRQRKAEQLIYRGQADATWALVPIVLRSDHREAFTPIPDSGATQLIHEFALLRAFCEFCDQCGVRVPGDSLEFRETALKLNNQQEYLSDITRWPNQQLLETMALAQHHGVPTRLLDWSRHPYSAVYFAAVSALRRRKHWTPESCLAVWVLDIESIAAYDRTIRVVSPAGSVSPNLAAQSGLFTVHVQHPAEDGTINVTGLEEEFIVPGDTPLTKLTLPTAESVSLYDYCRKVGTTGATLLPGATGAATAVMDSMYAESASRWLLENPTFEAQQTQQAWRRQGRRTSD